jgi:hypothetical protein
VLVGARIVSRPGRPAAEPAGPPGVSFFSPGREGSPRERAATTAGWLASVPGTLSEERVGSEQVQ